jgi:hypothetical protein
VPDRRLASLCTNESGSRHPHAAHNPTTAGGKIEAKNTGRMLKPAVTVNPFCQIEYVSGDSDVGMPCGNPAVVRCADCGAAIAMTVLWNAADSHSVNLAVTTTLRIHALGSLSKTSPTHFDCLLALRPRLIKLPLAFVLIKLKFETPLRVCHHPLQRSTSSGGRRGFMP